MSTTHSSFDQYCIRHKTISHRAAAATDREVRRKCPMTKLTALPLLATNPADTTAYSTSKNYKNNGALSKNVNSQMSDWTSMFFVCK